MRKSQASGIKLDPERGPKNVHPVKTRNKLRILMG
jgi:hypothetical protein